MKKVIIFVSLLLVPLLSNAQFLGLGTSASPYRGGTLKLDTTWYLTQSPVYVSGDLTIGTATDAGHLTIQAGVTVRFCATGADLIITGLGQLTASGASTSKIRFTADIDKDGSYGETGERWGHISFQSMGSAGASLIDYCIVEYGDVSSTSLTPADPCRYGGAIHSSFSNLTISNCEIRNNKAGWGGGIFINKNASPSISNCNIYSNSSISSGGGIYIWSNSSSVITNCIIFSNASTTNGGGGGIFLGDLCSSVRFFNSIIINNSSTLGANIRLYKNTNSTKPSFTNCIIWNPTNSISYSGQTAAASDFINCAIQSPSYKYYTNWVSLNASNTAINGPNFTATDGSDWSIKFISPCRDAGTTPSPTVPYDYIGNSRIYNYDIGAYEVQYSRWNGSSGTSWTEPLNWEEEVDPGSGSGDVVIPVVTAGNEYPIWTDITVGSGKYMIVDPNASVVVGDLTNNGTLRLRSGPTGYANMIINSSNTNTGTEIAELYLTGGAGTAKPYNYHYISSPIANLNIDSITRYTVNLLEYRNNDVTTDMQQGWHYWDDYPSYADPFSTLTLGRGYNVYHSAAGRTFNFKGTFNIADVNITLENVASPVAALHGRNLVGNPFTCSIDFDLVAAVLPEGVSKAIFFTSGSLGYVYYLSPVGGPNPSVTNIIPPMQGFFMKTTVPSGTSFILPTSAIVNDNSQTRYKKGGLSSDYPLVRLKLADETQSDYALIWFSKDATTGDDNDFDAGKLAENRLTIWTTTEGNDFAINGLPFPDTVAEIPVTLNIDSSGTYNISPYTIQNLDDYDVVLIDKTLSNTVNLKTTDTYTFTSDSGKIAGRFVIKIGNVLTAVENPSASASLFNIYYSRGIVNIIPLNDISSGTGNTVQIFDMTGRVIRQLDNIELNKGVPEQIQLDVPAGIYFVNITGGKLRFVKKFVIN